MAFYSRSTGLSRPLACPRPSMAFHQVLLPPPGSYPYYPNEAGPSGAGAVAGVGAGAGDYYDYGVRPGGRV